MKLLFVLISTVWFSNVMAMDSQGNYAVWGLGERSCHNFNQARQADDFDNFKNYIMGYLTAYNAMVQDTYSISGSMSLADVLDWMDNYCETKPILGFEQALIEFGHTFYDKRYRRPLTRGGR